MEMERLSTRIFADVGQIRQERIRKDWHQINDETNTPKRPYVSGPGMAFAGFYESFPARIGRFRDVDFRDAIAVLRLE